MSAFRIVVGVLLHDLLVLRGLRAVGASHGTVKDTNGRPIKGAIVRAVNRDASPSQITSTTDDKGRWAMIGLKTGTWQFTVEAPGFTPSRQTHRFASPATPPMGFALARDPGPIPGALDKNVIQSVTAANALRDRGQYDQALAAYQQIREQNPKLTSVAISSSRACIASRRRSEADPAARRALLDRAMNTYNQLLNDETLNARAKTELESTRSELQALPR